MNILNSIWRDLIHAVRSLAKARAFTFVCVLTLGIGMAPVIAIHYGMQVFTTPPPGVPAESLVELITTRVGSHRPTDKWSYPDFIDLRDAATGVSMFGWMKGTSEVTLPAGGLKRASETMFVTFNYFGTVGVALAQGPGFQQAGEPEVILVFRFWQRRLAADPDIVGKTLTVNGVPHVVVGIAPDQFESHLAVQDVELFLPLERHPSLLKDRSARFDRSKEWVHIHGRLSPGVSVAQASAAVSAVTSQLAAQYPATNEFRAGIAAPYDAVGNLEGEDLPIVVTLWHAMTVIPLLAVCLNISGMVQVRSAMRERELSIRQAIGASRRRLIQHLLAEAVLLAAAGAMLALILLFNIPAVVSWWMGEPLPAPFEAALRLHPSMIAFCTGLCLATSLVFGWLPALRFSRPKIKIMTVLKDEAGTGGIRAGRVHRVTTALQVVIAVPLLVLSAMSLERVRATATADLGFACDQLYAAPLDLAGPDHLRQGYGGPPKLYAEAERPGLRTEVAGANADFLIRKVRDSLARAGGVASVTIADGLPLDFRQRLARVSPPAEANVAPKVALAQATRVGEGYLNTMGIALVRGRAFTISDGAGAPMVTIVSKALADKLFPDADPIGQRLTFGAPGDDKQQPQMLTIVGVTADFPTAQMTTDREQLLLPLAQHSDVQKDSVPVEDDRRGAVTLMLVARGAAGEPAAKLTAALENTMRQVDRDFDPRNIVTGVSLRRGSMDDFLNMAGIGGTFGSVSLLLAAIGIYGVVGLMVATRTREIAVRVTLGASRSRVIGMILFDVVKLVSPGVAAGLLITGLVRLNGGVTVSNIEPLAYVAGAAIATLTAVLASLAPARRAASVDPMVAMRST